MYYYVEDSTSQSFSSILSITNPNLGGSFDDDEFGSSLKWYENTLYIGASGQDSENSDVGAIYEVFYSNGNLSSPSSSVTGTNTSEKLGQYLAVTENNSGDILIYSNSGTQDLLIYTKYSGGGTNSFRNSSFISSGNIIGLEAAGRVVVASQGSKLYYSGNYGSSFQSTTMSISKLSLFRDVVSTTAEKIGTYLMVYDVNPSPEFLLYKWSSTSSSFYQKQSLKYGESDVPNPGLNSIIGWGRQIFTGDPAAKKIYGFQ